MIYTGIVAHTARTHQAKQLAAAVGADFISFDTGLLGCDENHYHVQTHLGGLVSDWSIILEDDALPIADFTAQATSALVHAPSPIVSFYLGRKRPPHYQNRIRQALTRANETNAHWIVATRLLHAVAYAIRTPLLRSLTEHSTDLPADENVSDWAQRYGHTVAYTVGSLCDHADLPSLAHHQDRAKRTPGRVAWQTGGHTIWTSKAVTL